MSERNKGSLRASMLAVLVAGLFSGSALAEGNIQFGQGVPAVVELPQPLAATARTAKGGVQRERIEHGPGVNRAILAPVTPEESEQAIHARELPQGLNQGVPHEAGRSAAPGREPAMSAMRIAGDTAPTGPASIAELARALKNDPDLIYEYVRNNIAYYPTWGIQKGAIGALLDNQGTAFDQATLMVQLLKEAGFTASHVKGRINLTAAQVQDWLGIDTSKVCGVLNLFGQAQIPVSSVTATAAGSCPGSTAALHSMKFDHVWVKVNIDGTNYYFDPSFKSHVHKTGINLATASGYNASSYLSSAKSGATVNANYVQGINRNNIRNNLASYSNTLATYLRTNLPAGTLDDVIGGKTVAPYTGAPLRQTALPYRDTSVALTEWANIPASYSPTLRIVYQGIDKTYSSDAIYGKRLTITYNSANKPVLMLDGVAQATGTTVTPGTVGTVTFNVAHGAYGSTGANQNFTQQIKAGGTYLIGNGWGPAGRGLVERYRSQLDTAKAAGSADASEVVLGSSLAVLSASWIAQVNHSDYITDRLAATNTLFHHQVGIAGYSGAPYVDLPGNMVGVVSQSADAAKERAAFYSSAMHSSIFESAAVQQTAGVSAVSTVKLIDMAVAGNKKIYNATSANYASAVQPNLVGCASWLTTFQGQVTAGNRLILPDSCNLTEGSWTGTGYFTINSTGTSIGAIIGGGLAGGFGINNIPAGTVNNSANSAKSSDDWMTTVGKFFGDPIDMAKGNFVYADEDIQTGVGEFPHSLGVNKLYSSSARTQDGPLGKGWTHSLAASVRVGSDGFQSMGEDSALDAVPTLVEKLVALDLLGDAAKPLDKMVVATVGQRWFADQLIDNTVVVAQGLNGEVFVKLPDGSYNPPPGNAARLTKQGDGTYQYETLNRAKLAFNSAGKLATYTHPSGVQAKFTYSGANLTKVANSLGRVLNFSYSGARISAVSDGTRSIGYAYDSSGNLVSSTDATAKATTFQYDQPGRMTKFFKPSNPSVAFATNVYDSLGRVQTQTNAAGKLYTYHFAGSRSEEVDPDGVGHVSYFNAQGKVLKAIDKLGRVTTNTYDGQGRLTRKTFPEGNALEYSYDDAPCAAADKRCTHNVTEVKQLPKPGSGLATLTSSFTYESAFNKVASATDALGKVTTYTYTAQGNPLTVTAPVDAAGVQPQTTYGYTAYTASGYPSFYLQTSQTSKINASATVVSTTAYNAANKYVPQTVVADSGTGKLNLTTTFSFDAVGNLTQVNGPRTDVTDTTTHAYDGQRRVTQTTDALGKQTRFAYDNDGRLIRSAAQLGSQWLVSCTSYTTTGKLLKSWGPALTSAATTCPTAAAPVAVTDYAYDDLDRLIRVTENLPAGEGGNRVTETVYNADDSVQSVNRAVGTALAQTYAAYTYSNNGLPLTLTDAKNNRTTYEYDGHDRRVKLRYPHPTTVGTSSTSDYEQFTYDAVGNVTKHRKRSGQNVTLAYDNLHRLISRTYPTAADNVAFSYDLLGRRTQAKYANNSHTVDYVWDAAGRLTSTTAGTKTLAYQYDPAGNRTRTTWPETAFYVTTTYDALNRPTAIKETGTVNLASYAYDDLSRRTTVTLGNGTTTTYGYGAQGTLSSLAHNLAGTAQDVTYSYTRNQVQEVVSQSWTNDLYQWMGYANGTQSYTVNGRNQYTAAAGASITHDNRGNLTGDGVWTYVYDVDNKLKSANKSGYAATLAYDAEGRLRRTTLAGTVTDLMYDGVDLVAEYDSAGTVLRRYVHGPGVDEALVWYEGTATTDKTWLYADHLGSIVAAANSGGTNTAIYRYGPYGEPDTTTGVRFRYTGQQYLGGLNLYYYKARFYSPTLGRFLQTDPIGTRDDLNLYAYVGNNPVNFNDPTGLVAAEVKMLLCGVSCDVASFFPKDAPIVTVGNAFGGLGAAAVGWMTGDDALYNAAVEGLSATRAKNVETLILLGTLKSSGAGKGVRPEVNWGQQAKHFPGHNNYMPGKSTLTANPSKLADKAGTGQQIGNVPVGSPGSKERVDFGENIGKYVDLNGSASATSNGIIHYGKNGIHIVPARP
ncbi:RHS repeat-associated core domain-containing protein [Thauera butanivorans]|uniref:RHS repeat-associated core domain-containing protein n=1 Tax=Thauera butanivorans TaxID=86174 RepID=UPI003AB66994